MAILHGSWIPSAGITGLQSADLSQVEDGSIPKGKRPESGFFFIWGETWRRIHDPVSGQSGIHDHPLAIAPSDLVEFLRSLQASQRVQVPLIDRVPEPKKSSTRKTTRKTTTKSATEELLPEVLQHRWRSLTAILPTHRSEDGTMAPLHSANSEESNDSESLVLHPWQVGGFWLTPLESIQFLQRLPLGLQPQQDSPWGTDLRFWSHVSRWNLDLLARSKFLPRLLSLGEHRAIAQWQVLLDSTTDQERLARFAHQMPPVCRAYLSVLPPPSATQQDPVLEVAPLILKFLHASSDAQIRAAIAQRPLPATQFPKDIPLRDWLQALRYQETVDHGTEPEATAPNNNPKILVSEGDRLGRLDAALNTWTTPIQRQLTQQIAAFRTGFVLNPPHDGAQDWTLTYCLQATDDPNFQIEAGTIWENPVDQLAYNGRVISNPQETLLAGLGSASRVYPPIETSLQEAQPLCCTLNPSEVYQFLKATVWQLQDSGFGVILPPSLASQGGWANRLGLSVKLDPPKSDGSQRLGLQSLLNFKWELSIGGQRISQAEFERLVALNTPLVEINGEWVELRRQDIKSAQKFFDSRKDQRSLSLEDALRISTGDTQMIDKLPVVDFDAAGTLQNLLSTLTTGSQSVEPLPTPEGFRGELRPYQVRGFSWMAFLEQWGLGACLADDMGLGKTIQLIALLLYLKQEGGLEKPTLLVCPTSVLGNWQREVKRFAPSLNVLVHHGDKRNQGKAFAKAVAKIDLVITSYSLTHRDAKTLQSVSWQGIVLDEAQNIKNAQAKQSQAVRSLDTQFRIALTGTPVENRLSELWSILDFLNPGYLGPWNFFQRRFAVPIERYGDTDSLRTLRSLVQPFILRRLKTDRTIIQDLPEKQEMTVFCGLAVEQAEVYQQLVERSLTDIDSADGIQRRGMILALLTKLKQVCNHPQLLAKEDENPPSESSAKSKKSKSRKSVSIASEDLLRQSGKVQRLQAMLEEVLDEGDRALIFTQFAEWGKQLQRYLSEHFQQEVFFLYGSTTAAQREAMIARFQNDPQAPRIFILSLKAGGVGLNLTRANHVFHFDRWWNPAVENQATDRVFRIGQTRNVQVHKFVCAGTLEERIHEIIESKKALSEQVVGTGENWLTEFDTNQLRDLLLLDRTSVIEEE